MSNPITDALQEIRERFMTFSDSIIDRLSNMLLDVEKFGLDEVESVIDGLIGEAEDAIAELQKLKEIILSKEEETDEDV